MCAYGYFVVTKMVLKFKSIQDFLYTNLILIICLKENEWILQLWKEAEIERRKIEEMIFIAYKYYKTILKIHNTEQNLLVYNNS